MVHIPTQEIPIPILSRLIWSQWISEFWEMTCFSFLLGRTLLCCSHFFRKRRASHGLRLLDRMTRTRSSTTWDACSDLKLDAITSRRGGHANGGAVWAMGKGWEAIRWQWCSENWEGMHGNNLKNLNVLQVCLLIASPVLILQVWILLTWSHITWTICWM